MLMIAETCPLILPIHRDLDALREDASGAGKIGTTRRGIGPAYEDKVGRRAIRVCDLAHLDDLGPAARPPVRPPRRASRRLRRAAGRPRAAAAATSPRSPTSCCRSRGRCGATSTRRCARASGSCSKARRACCSTSTTAPIRSSPRPTPSPERPGRAAASARRGAGFVLGIVKAYTTRVGSGPFPTEQDNEIGQQLGERGHEFGTVTGRQRRCGWFDAVLVRQAVAVSGVTGVALTKLDVLDGFETVKICTGYRIGGQAVRLSPAARRRPGAGRAGLRGDRGLAGLDPRRAQLGRPAGAGDQICPPHRGADPLPGGAGQHLARARRHDPGPRPVRGLVPHLETVEARTVRHPQTCDVVDPRRRRAAAQPLDHLLNGAPPRPRYAPRPRRRGNCGPSRSRRARRPARASRRGRTRPARGRSR